MGRDQSGSKTVYRIINGPPSGLHCGDGFNYGYEDVRDEQLGDVTNPEHRYGPTFWYRQFDSTFSFFGEKETTIGIFINRSSGRWGSGYIYLFDTHTGASAAIHSNCAQQINIKYGETRAAHYIFDTQELELFWCSMADSRLRIYLVEGLVPLKPVSFKEQKIKAEFHRLNDVSIMESIGESRFLELARKFSNGLVLDSPGTYCLIHYDDDFYSLLKSYSVSLISAALDDQSEFLPDVKRLELKDKTGVMAFIRKAIWVDLNRHNKHYTPSQIELGYPNSDSSFKAIFSIM